MNKDTPLAVQFLLLLWVDFVAVVGIHFLSMWSSPLATILMIPCVLLLLPQAIFLMLFIAPIFLFL